MSDFTENSQSANRLVTLSTNDTPRKWVEESWEKCLVSGDPGHSRLGHGQDTAVRGRRIKVSGDLNCSDRSGFLLDEVLEGAER